MSSSGQKCLFLLLFPFNLFKVQNCTLQQRSYKSLQVWGVPSILRNDVVAFHTNLLCPCHTACWTSNLALLTYSLFIYLKTRKFPWMNFKPAEVIMVFTFSQWWRNRSQSPSDFTSNEVSQSRPSVLPNHANCDEKQNQLKASWRRPSAVTSNLDFNLGEHMFRSMASSDRQGLRSRTRRTTHSLSTPLRNFWRSENGGRVIRTLRTLGF